MCWMPPPAGGSTAPLVITGHGADEVESAIAGSGAQLRAPDAAAAAPATRCSRWCRTCPTTPGSTTLILNGDVPLIAAGTAQALVQACGGTRLALLTIELPDPTGYGRIVRAGRFGRRRRARHRRAQGRHAGAAQIREVYTGMMAAPTALLKRWVMALKNDNAQREYYLTDIVAMAVAEGVPVVASRWPTRPRCWASTARCSWPTWSAASSAARPTR
jgi:bifunctional UDP-N-acetylglucosamine pyrophosphorylase/glucosamine-1-phosphate N-acetyltransferase